MGVHTVRARQQEFSEILFKNILLGGVLCLLALSLPPPAHAIGNPTACTAVPAVTTGSEVAGALDAVADCFQAPPNRLIDNYALTLAEPAVLDLVLDSAAFGGAVGIRHPNPSPGVPGQFIGQRGRNTTGAVTAHFVLPAGSYVVYVTSVITNPTTPPAGDYTLDLNIAASPQAACENGALNGSGIVRNSVASGAISAQDCELGPREDLVVGDVPRNVDSYSLFAPLNVYNQFTVEADFDYRIERWEAVGANPLVLEGYLDFMPAGSTRHYSIQTDVNATHFLYIAAATPGEGGNYTLTVQDYPAQQHSALMEIYTATGGDNWTVKTGWGGAAGTECSWFGITCTNGMVTQLHLPDNNLSGTLPEALSVLNRVSSLDLSENALSGSLPVSLGYMDELRYLNLFSNQFSGLLPASLAYSDILVSLSLSSNQFTGPIPEYLAEKEDLQRLYLSGNQFSGPIPASLADLPALTHLHLQYNKLTGVVPQALLDMGLTEFQYNNNPFDLTDPDERAALLALYDATNGAAWTNKTHWGDAAGTECTWFGVVCSDGHVLELQLIGNNLAGPLPAALGDLSGLRNLMLRNNDLTGTLPASLGQLTQLQTLDLGDNLLTGTLPAEWAGMSALKSLYLYTNQLSGNIPVWLGDMTTLERLSLSANQFTGPIPAALGELSNLQQLYLSGNQLTGEIPAALADLASLSTLHLQFNQLIGSVPAGLEDIDDLQVNNNPFSTESADDREALVALYNATGGENWLNNSNWLNETPGTLCTWYGITCSSGRVIGINMQITLNNIGRGNRLAGELPEELGLLTQLRNLILPHNQLSGTIPQSLGTLTQLRQLNLLANQLTGTIPENLGNLSLLTQLQLGNNKLTGGIPSTLGDLANLTILNLNSNMLSGSIPASLGSLAALTSLRLSDNQLTGSLPSELGNLSNLTLLEARTNLLSGGIPDSFAALDKVATLLLQGNHFSGSIPTVLADMALLNTANLGLNDFSGGIPAALGEAPVLTGLVLAFNELTGSIPPELATIGTLRFLQLQNNRLSGGIPAAFEQLSALETLWLQNNPLTGTFPAAVGALPLLSSVDVTGTSLDLPEEGSAQACTTPAPLLPGGAVAGALVTDEDCFSALGSSLDRFELTLAEAAVVTATLESAQFKGMIGLNAAEGEHLLGSAGTTGTAVSLQFALPAGQYRPFVSSAGSNPVAPFSGAYEFELSDPVAQAQDGCSVANSTVVVPGSSVQGNLQANDCVSNVVGDNGRAYDRYLIGLRAGEQIWISVEGDIDLRHTLRYGAFNGLLQGAVIEDDLAAEETDTVTFVALSAGNHSFAVMPSRVGQTGAYSLYFASHAPLPDAQRNALFTLYNSTNGDGWADHAGWLGHPGTECTWAGITCVDGVLTGIDLSDNLLTGTIPAALGELSGLQSLNLADNNLAGVVPDVFSDTVLINVENNPLDFTLPAQIVSRGDDGVFYLKSGNLFSFFYDVSNADSTLTGLGLSVHIDSSVVATARFTNVLSTGLVSYDSTLSADSGNADGIASTDRLLNIAWADFNGAWPGTLPVKLFDLEVKAQDSATVSTPVRIGFARTANASQYRLTLPSVTLTPVRESFDVDRDGTVQALSDALLIVRNMFEFSGDALIAQAIANGAVNNTLGGIVTRLAQLDPALDVDRNGSVDALTDGLLVLRYLFGFRGDVLVDDAIGEGATRATAAQIETYLAGFTQL